MSDIDSLAQSVRDFSQNVDFWNQLMIAGLAIAAAATVFVVIATRIIVIRTGQLSTAQDRLGEARDRQLRADLKDKDIEIGTLRLSAASLEVEAARLRTQLAAQERRADILMDPNLRPHFVARIARFKGQPFDVVSCGIKESEIEYFSMAIWGTLSGAGWNIGKIENNSPSCSAGLLVLVNPTASVAVREAAKALLDGFVALGLAPKQAHVGNVAAPPPEPRAPVTWFLESSHSDSVLVLVGTHP